MCLVADEKKSWLEVSLQCSGELAEAVAEVFARYCPEGVVLDNITRYDPAQAFNRVMRVAAYLRMTNWKAKAQPGGSALVHGRSSPWLRLNSSASQTRIG